MNLKETKEAYDCNIPLPVVEMEDRAQNVKYSHPNWTEQYLKMPFKEWDGKAMLYSDLLDKYFADEDSIDMAVENNNIKYEDLRLIICDPVKLDPIDPDVIFEEFLPEGYSFSEIASMDLRMAVIDLNVLIADEKQWSWEQGDYRTDGVLYYK